MEIILKKEGFSKIWTRSIFPYLGKNKLILLVCPVWIFLLFINFWLGFNLIFPKKSVNVMKKGRNRQF